MPRQKSTRAEILHQLQRAQRTQGAYSTLHSATIAARAGIGSVELECCDLLQLHGPLPAGKLGDLVGLGPSTTTSVVDRLEKAGFVERTRHDTDRRVVLVRMRPSVAATFDPHYTPIRRHSAGVHKTFTNAELLVVTRYLEAASDALAAAVLELRSDDDA